MSMIKIENLTFSYPTSYDNVFENVSFQVDTDWKLGFVGRNGRGKTTFLNLLLGKYEYSGKILSSVQFDYFPYPVSDKNRITEDILQEICPLAEEWELMRELSYLDVDVDVLWRPFETLSNGEQTKVLIAALFLNEGHFLLIDEPTNHLDAKARKSVAAYLKKKKGFILVSHDRRFLDDGLNPEKLGAVSSYLCDPATAHAEFMLVKNQYQGETDRRAGHGALCYQIRQAFPHGEVTAEEANRIGYETAMRWTKGKYQFFVCTHIDKEHIHNHIYYNSTAYDRSRKFRNFIGSSFALRRLSDRVCLEHDLSVIANPKLHSKGRYLHYGQWLGENQKLSQKEQIRLAIDAALTERPEDFADFLRRMETAGIQVKHGRGGVISFLVPGQQRAARFRAATLGDGYGPEDVQAVIDGKAPTRTAPVRRAPAPRRVNLLIDIQERMRQGKGPTYERWAKVYNLKQMAAALQYLKEHQLFEYDDLAAKTDAATERFHTLAGDIQHTEAELSRVSDLMAAVVQYAKTRPAFDGYKAAKYSRKYLAEHEAELADYRAAKATMAELLGGEKLPKMDVLKEKRRQLAARKKALYLEYRKAQQDMRELVAVKGSVDHLRGLTDSQRNKEQAR